MKTIAWLTDVPGWAYDGRARALRKRSRSTTTGWCATRSKGSWDCWGPTLSCPGRGRHRPIRGRLSAKQWSSCGHLEWAKAREHHYRFAQVLRRDNSRVQDKHRDNHVRRRAQLPQQQPIVRAGARTYQIMPSHSGDCLPTLRAMES